MLMMLLFWRVKHKKESDRLFSISDWLTRDSLFSRPRIVLPIVNEFHLWIEERYTMESSIGRDQLIQLVRPFNNNPPCAPPCTHCLLDDFKQFSLHGPLRPIYKRLMQTSRTRYFVLFGHW